ncbi:hypothetical protein LTR12_014722 [Friedmanniomyces endolithicus]|nr:hypothetical protein LTR12_014722 [Friedmanniomyces endolithicus]
MVGDSAAYMVHWGSINMTKAALNDPRIKPDPDQVVRMSSGRMRDHMDFMTGFASIAPLYSAPDDLKAQAEVNVDEVIGAAFKPHWETANAAMGDCLSHYDMRDKLQDANVPAFVEEIAEKLPNAKLVIYEKSGHLAALEEKTAFQRDARQFIRTLSIASVSS